MNVPYIIYNIECVCYLEKIFIASTKLQILYLYVLSVFECTYYSNIYSRLLWIFME